MLYLNIYFYLWVNVISNFYIIYELSKLLNQIKSLIFYLFIFFVLFIIIVNLLLITINYFKSIYIKNIINNLFIDELLPVQTAHF